MEKRTANLSVTQKLGRKVEQKVIYWLCVTNSYAPAGLTPALARAGGTPWLPSGPTEYGAFWYVFP